MAMIEREAVKMPAWVVVVLVTILMGVITGAIQLGMLTQSVYDLRERVTRIEDALVSHVK